MKPNQRDILIEHIDGPCAVVICHTTRLATVRSMVRRGLLRYEFRTGCIPGANPSPRPKLTFITEAGRAALAGALADWADALCRIARFAPNPAPPRSPAEPAEAHIAL